MKKLVVSLIAMVLVGCSPPSSTEQHYGALPEEFKDCKIFRVSNENGTDRIILARCPNSTTSTTYSEGKSKATTVVVDGVEYVKK